MELPRERELRVLHRLNAEAEVSSVSPRVLLRLVILGLAKEFEGRVFITYDGMLLIGREKPAG